MQLIGTYIVVMALEQFCVLRHGLGWLLLGHCLAFASKALPSENLLRLLVLGGGGGGAEAATNVGKF